MCSCVESLYANRRAKFDELARRFKTSVTTFPFISFCRKKHGLYTDVFESLPWASRTRCRWNSSSCFPPFVFISYSRQASSIAVHCRSDDGAAASAAANSTHCCPRRNFLHNCQRLQRACNQCNRSRQQVRLQLHQPMAATWVW